MHDGWTREQNQVSYVPHLKINLIFGGTLNSHGCVMKIENGTIKVIKVVMTLMREIKKNDLYLLDGHTTIREAIIAEQWKMPRVQLWHLRLGTWWTNQKTTANGRQNSKFRILWKLGGW